MPAKHLNLNVETEIFTLGNAAEIVNSILEFLLFRRNQIPFVYQTYRYYVSTWSELKDNDGVANTKTNLSTYQFERQRELAIETRNSISEMRETIRQCFQENTIKTMRFLFGSSPFTPIESYTVHIPTKSIDTKHYHDNHQMRRDRLNQILIHLLSHERLFDIFSNDINPTNVFLQIETTNQKEKLSKALNDLKIYPKDQTKMPQHCKDVHFHLTHCLPENFEIDSLNCCKNLIIYQDASEDELNEENSLIAEDEYGNEQDGVWWEYHIKVRGFKEKPVKGKTIWTL